MSKNLFIGNYAIILALVVLFIIYGSLYPFHFQSMPSGAMQSLLQSWASRPGRGDAIANVLLYTPLGYFAALALSRRVGPVVRLAVPVALGLAISVGVELLQYYDAGRDSSLTDVYTNLSGAILGASAAAVFGSDWWQRLPRPRFADAAAILFLLSWAGYNLFPFAPTIDLHKYLDALKPVLLHPSFTYYGIFTHAASWVAAAVLIDTVVQGRRSACWYAGFVALALGGKIVVIDGSLTVAIVAGAAIGWAWALLMPSHPRLMPILATALLGLAVLALRLEPFQFLPTARDFGWIPFSSLIQGSVATNTLVFMEKFFLYGSLIWLLQVIGCRLAVATGGVAAMLFVTSWVERYLPGRSAEITDAVLALVAGLLIALLRNHRPQFLEPAQGNFRYQLPKID